MPPPPPLMLSLVFQCLSAPDLIQAHFVSKDWLREFSANPALACWFHRQLLLYSCPWATLPEEQKGESTEFQASKLKDIYFIRQSLIKKSLPAFWSATESEHNNFRQSCQRGKYSRWVLCARFDDSSFIADLAWAVRILCCLAPPAYSTLDGAAETPYNPIHSTRASSTAPGWHLISDHNTLREVQPQLLFGDDQFGGLFIVDIIVNPRASYLQFEGHVDVLQLVYERLSEDAKKSLAWKKATDLEEHTKLVATLTHSTETLRGLFWDADGVASRNVLHLLARGENYDRWNIMCRPLGLFGQPHPRQIPPIFNMVKLGKHVESLSWAGAVNA